MEGAFDFIVSSRLLNTECLSYTSVGFINFLPILILAKTEVFDCLLSFNLRNMEDLEVLSFPILLNAEGCCCDVDGRN